MARGEAMAASGNDQREAKLTPEQWKKIDELVQAGLERDPEDRSAFLDQACHGDEARRQEVASVISYDRQASQFLEHPIIGPAEIIAVEDNSSLIGSTLGRY